MTHIPESPINNPTIHCGFCSQPCREIVMAGTMEFCCAGCRVAYEVLSTLAEQERMQNNQPQ